MIKPAVVGDLSWVKGRYDSVRGPIVSEWRREKGEFTLEVSIPPNTTATVFLPARLGDPITEGGVAADRSPQVRYLRRESECAVYAIGSGNYRFTVSQP